MSTCTIIMCLYVKYISCCTLHVFLWIITCLVYIQNIHTLSINVSLYKLVIPFPIKLTYWSHKRNSFFTSSICVNITLLYSNSHSEYLREIKDIHLYIYTITSNYAILSKQKQPYRSSKLPYNTCIITLNYNHSLLVYLINYNIYLL